MKFMNLQLFANHLNVTTDTRNTQTTPYNAASEGGANTLSAEMKTFYDMTLIDEASAQLVHDQFGQKRPIPQGGGKVIEFRKFSPLPKATTALTEGVTPDGKRLDVTAITAEVSQYGDYITQSDILELTALDNTILEATKLLGRQAGLTLDTVTRNVLNSGLNVSFPDKNVSGTPTKVETRSGLDTTAVLNVKTVQKAVAKLKGQNAPKINGAYVGIIHPYNSYQLMQDPEWKYPHQYQDTTNLYEGEIGMVAGVRFVESTEAKIWKQDSDSIYSTLIIGDGAYGVTEITGGGLTTIVKQKGSAGTADPLDQRSSVGWKAIKTAELLIPSYLVRIESCVPDFNDVAAN